MDTFLALPSLRTMPLKSSNGIASPHPPKIVSMSAQFPENSRLRSTARAVTMPRMDQRDDYGDHGPGVPWKLVKAAAVLAMLAAPVEIGVYVWFEDSNFRPTQLNFPRRSSVFDVDPPEKTTSPVLPEMGPMPRVVE